MDTIAFSLGLALAIFGLIGGLWSAESGIGFDAMVMLSGAILLAGGTIGWAIRGRGR